VSSAGEDHVTRDDPDAGVRGAVRDVLGEDVPPVVGDRPARIDPDRAVVRLAARGTDDRDGRDRRHEEETDHDCGVSVLR
jgi:hypothetical protein